MVTMHDISSMMLWVIKALYRHSISKTHSFHLMQSPFYSIMYFLETSKTYFYHSSLSAKMMYSPCHCFVMCLRIVFGVGLEYTVECFWRPKTDCHSNRPCGPTYLLTYWTISIGLLFNETCLHGLCTSSETWGKGCISPNVAVLKYFPNLILRAMLPWLQDSTEIIAWLWDWDDDRFYLLSKW